MRTQRKKNNNNKTKKMNLTKLKPSMKILPKGYPLYASKQYEGATILEYNKSEEKKYNDKCLMQNSSWFGDLEVAKSYRTKDTHIYRWNVKKHTNLLKTDIKNKSFIEFVFKNTKQTLEPTIKIPKDHKNIKYSHPYLEMSTNERALYEFNFCFGYLTVTEQYQFMKLLKYLLENKIIDLKTRQGDSILKKIKLKIYYYKVGSLFGKKELSNRLSFYDFDKHAIMNLCKIANSSKYKINGVYQKNDTSFWFPDLVLYKMNIQEYILFNPQDNLIYDTIIE
uniref:Uncharacterized protein n=1 Tax=viral metagenome TaxID=1070528 RepID=A0A6C0ICX3_9ZZZZ